MGNYKFRLSDMIPNAWFYKLTDMRRARDSPKKTAKKKSKCQNQIHGFPSASASPSRASTDHFHSFSDRALPRSAFELYPCPSYSPDLPRASDSYRRKSSRKTVYRPSPCSRRLASWRHSLWTDDDLKSSPPDHYFESPAPPSDGYDSSISLVSGSPRSSSDEIAASPHPCSSCNCRTIGSSNTASAKDIIIDMNHENCTSPNTKEVGNTVSSLSPKLRPISTRRATPNVKSSAAALRRASFKLDSSKQHDHHPAPHCATSAGIRLRTSGARVASRKMQAARARRSCSYSPSAASVHLRNKDLASSYAMTKLSLDPERDFRDSMEEMITGHNIRASKDLEDLLTCFLSLNSREYHDHIIRAFEDIWFDKLYDE